MFVLFNGMCQETQQILNCKFCSKEFKKIIAEIKKVKNHFCGRSCAAKYNNANKKQEQEDQNLKNGLKLSYLKIFQKSKSSTIKQALSNQSWIYLFHQLI